MPVETPAWPLVAEASSGDYIESLFHSLAASWRQETAVYSDPERIAMNPSYQKIIGLGPAVIPLILQDLKIEPDHWFWALRAVTREDPVLSEHVGDINLMASDWLSWGSNHGYGK